MSYKSICVGLLRGDARNEQTAASAIKLAVETDAHLTGLLLVPPLNIPAYAAVPLPEDIISKYNDNASAEAAALHEEFENGCRAAGLSSFEWQGAAARAVMQNLEEIAPVTDLFVLTQHGEGDYSWLIGEASLSLAVPVLAIPEAGTFDSFGRNILLAWTPRRECARAVREALPMLQAAERVVVFRGNAPDDNWDMEVGAYLARHGVKAEIKHVVANDVSVGDAVLNTVTDESCDMIVMGSYGHSRIREVAFGGVTRDVLRHMTVPTLLSH